MKGNVIFFLLFFSIVLTALVDSYGVVSHDPSAFLFPMDRAQEAKIDTLEAKLARLQANGSVIIPIRQGFPYCEPFTGNLLERPNTVVGGFGGANGDHKATLTSAPGQNNGVLQLTNTNSPSQLGYAFIDLPFSSTYGIKVAFEYFIYNSTNPTEPGDGISFFLYDGAISASDFRIGGLGGSLGYAPHGYSNHNGLLPFSGDPGVPPPPANLFTEGEQGFGGLKGGYLGIGFDVWGKYGNEYERRYGGFLRPNDYWASHAGATQPRYPNSVVVRGPQIIAANEYRRNGLSKDYADENKIAPPYNSYQFVSGKVTYVDPVIPPGSDVDLGTGSLNDPGYFLSPGFKLGALGRVNDCSENGYRKVFIDFKPINPTNPSAGYQIRVDMLVNNGAPTPQLVNILNTTFIPSQQVPASFKLGFAGATGSKQAFQEIRNVTAQVSNENQLTKPETDALDGTACIGSEDFFELDVTLRNINSQIQCIQLYKTEAEALEISDQIDDISSVQDCESGICQIEVCSQERLTEQTPLGDFEAFLFLENGQEVPKVQFKSTSGATGSTTIWYTVTDNFGQISAPKPITITINPFPKIDGSETIIGPTCDGQSDGSISNVVLKDLIPGYTFSWADAAGNVLPNYTVTDTPVGGYLQATVGVSGVNLGKYFLTVNNPATNSRCDDVFEFEVLDERGSPVLVNLDNQEICQGTPVVFEPQLEDASDASNPSFVWWKDNNKTQPITHNLTEGGVTYQVTAPGILTVTGLSQRAAPYEYYVEVKADPSQNLCATPAGSLRKVEVLVLPPLVLDAVVVNDLCLVGAGEITVNAAGGFGTYTYSLDGAAAQSSNKFSGLSPGTYTIEVSAGTNCIGTLTKEVLGAPELFLTEDKFFNPACGVANGLIEVSFTGGTPAYKLELFKNGVLEKTSASPTSPIVYQDLAPGNYQVKVSDANGCSRVIDRNLTNDVGIPITVGPMADEICEGDVAVLTPTVTTAGNAALKWYKDAAATQEITSSATPDGNGHTYTINSSTMELRVSGLKAGNLSYYLASSGAGYCPTPPFKADVSVLPPLTATLATTDEICVNAADGTITVTAAGADGNYEYSLNGGAFGTSNVFAGLAPGTYTVDVRSTGPNACTFQASATILGPSGPIAINTPDVLRSSCDLANGSIDNLTISGGWGDYQAEWRKGSLTGAVVPGSLTGASNLSPDTYYLIVTDEKGCSVNFNFVVEEMPDPVFVVAPVDICDGEEAVLTPVNTVAGSADSDLKWFKDAALSQPVITGQDAGNSAISYSVDASGKLTVKGLPGSETSYKYYLQVVCTQTVVEVEVMVRIIPDVVFETSPEICFGAADGKIKVVSGEISTLEYSVDGGAPMSQSALEASSFAPKIYSISVTNAGLCVQTYQVEVLGPPSAITRVSFDEIRSSCNLSNGSIENVVIAGGWGEYTVEWRKGTVTGPLVSGDITGAADLAPDTYYLLVTDKEACVATFEFTVVEQPQPVYAVSQSETCFGEEVVLKPVNTISGSSPTELKWYKNAAKTQPVQNGPDPSDPDVIYSIDPDSGELHIQGLKGSASAYSYFLHVTCSDQLVEAKALVRVVPEPEFTTEPVTCFGGTDGKIIVGSGGDSKYLYSVDGALPVTEAQLEALSFSAKIYTVEVTNEGFCQADFTVEVVQPVSQLAVLPLTQIDPGCGADVGIIRTQITGGWSPYQVTVIKNGTPYNTKSVPGPAYEITSLSPGVYSLQVVDAQGCQVSSNTVTLEYGPTTIEVENVGICEGEIAVFAPTALPAASGASFSWFKNSNLTIPVVSSATPDANGHVHQISANGTLTVSGLNSTNSPVSYFVTISGGNSCPGFKKEVTAVVNRIPALTFTVQDEVCLDEKGTINLIGSSGDGTFTYSLDGVNFQNSGSFAVDPGTYTGHVKSGAGCVVSLPNITVLGPASKLTVSEPSKTDATCNSADGMLSFDIAGGYGDYTVAVKRNGVAHSTTQFAGGNFVLTGLPSGSYAIEVTDSGGCAVAVPAPVAINDLATPISATDDVICEGEVASITPSTTQQGITPVFTWYLDSNGTNPINSGTSNGITYQINNDGTLTIAGLDGRSDPYTYYVKLTSSNVCEPPLLPVEVRVYAIPNLRVSNPSIVCDPNGTVDLTQFIEGFNTSVYDYMIYSPSGNLMKMDEIDGVDQSGSYLVQSSLKGGNCWTPNQRIQVLISEEELIPGFEYQADMGGGNFIPNSDAQILEPVNFTDVSLGKVIIWNWDFGDGGTSNQQNPTHIYQKKGTYTVTLTTIDEIGCISEIKQTISVLDDYVIIVPNAFTPTGAKNQYFKPQFRGVASMEFYIFNTWGELIFQSTSLETLGWDGTLKGQVSPNGNYVYRALFETRSGEKIEKTGVFTLIR